MKHMTSGLHSTPKNAPILAAMGCHGDARGFVGRVDGISVPVDINACYRDYPEIIRANLLNGWKCEDKPDKPKDEMISIPKAELERLRDDLAAVLGAVKRMLKIEAN